MTKESILRAAYCIADEVITPTRDGLEMPQSLLNKLV
jgi:hypothetical protein